MGQIKFDVRADGLDYFLADAETHACRRLLSAILYRAYCDATGAKARNGGPPNALVRDDIRREARRWFRSDNAREGSYRWVMASLGLPMLDMRKLEKLFEQSRIFELHRYDQAND